MSNWVIVMQLLSMIKLGPFYSLKLVGTMWNLVQTLVYYV